MIKNLVQKKLFFTFYVLFLFAVISISLLSYVFVFKQLKDREIKNIVTSTSSTKKSLEMILRIVENFNEVIYKNDKIINLLKNPDIPITQEEEEKIDEFLNNFILINSFTKGIHIIGKDNRFFTSNIDFDKDSVKRLIPKSSGVEKTKLSVDYYNPFYTYEVIPYHAPIYDFDNDEIIGTLLIDISIDSFSELFVGAAMESEEKILITDKDNNIIFNFPANVDLNYFLKRIDHDKSIYIDDNILISKERVKYTDWKYIRIIPLNKTTLKYQELIRLMIVLLSMIAIFSSILTFKFSVVFTKPVIELNRKFKEMEKGNLDLNVNFNSNDEFEELGNSFNKMVKELGLLIKKQFEDQQKKNEMKFQILQAQINPHFLYNTLDSIRWMAIIQNFPRISDMVNSIIHLLEYNISIEDDVVSIRMELESIKNYLNIQKYRYGNSFEAFYEIDDTLLDHKIVRFSLQPLIENSFFHAFDLDKKTGIFKISLFKEEDNITLEIWDNGKGLSSESKKDKNKMHTGIGLKNIDERIKLFFGDNYGLVIFSPSGGGTTVKITLPLENI